MIDYGQAIVLGLLQGVTELFPVSSLGHSVILPRLLGWDIGQNDPLFVTFLVATHFATLVVLLGFFWHDWLRIGSGLLRSLRRRDIGYDDPYARLGWLLIVGTIPAGFIGLIFESKIEALFASPQIAAFGLILNGVLLLAAELLKRRSDRVDTASSDSDAFLAWLSWNQAVGIGAMQALALIPGFSRTGASLAGGILAGLSHEDAARFAFLLATPIIGAASLLRLPRLLGSGAALERGPFLLGALCAGISAYFAVRFLVRYFRTNRLTPFAVYCAAVGIGSSYLLYGH